MVKILFKCEHCNTFYLTKKLAEHCICYEEASQFCSLQIKVTKYMIIGKMVKLTS